MEESITQEAEALTKEHGSVLADNGFVQERARTDTLLDAAGICAVFGQERQDIRTYSPLVLAYIGDAVYEVIVRTVLVERGNMPVEKLHKAATHYVKASAQAAAVEALLPEFSGEERDVYRRGRNAKPHTMPKNAAAADYLKATGLEAVVGWLYLKGDTARMLELVRQGMEVNGD